jgi:hypothetical protein
MGAGDTGAMVAALLDLVKSPRVKYIGREALRTGLPNVGGPLRSPSMPNFPQRTGAAPRQQGPQYNPNIGSDLGSVLGSVFGNMQQQQQQTDPLQDLYSELLEQLQAPVAQPQSIDTQDLMNQVRAAINPIYDERESRAKRNAQQATGQIRDMYGALSQDFQKLAPEQIKQAQEAQAQIEQLYGQLRSNITGSYARVSEEQADLFKQLGIEDALPDVLAEQQQPVTEALNAASQTQAQQEQRYMDIGQMDSTYYREGAPNAILTGNEVSQDLLSQLQDYLSQAEAERTSGIQTAYMDQLGQAQGLLAQQQQAAQSEAGRRQEMLWQMLQSQLQGRQQQKQQPLNPDTYMASLPSSVQNSVAGAFTQLQRSPEAVYGKVEDKRNPVPGTFVETTPQWYMAQADQMLKNGQIDPATHQALLMYMQLYFGLGGSK